MVPILTYMYCMLCRVLVRVNHRAAEEEVALHLPAAPAAVSPSIQAAPPCLPYLPCHQHPVAAAASAAPLLTSPHRRLGAGEPLVAHLGVEAKT